MNRVRDICRPVTLSELMQVTEIWVDTALQLGDKPLRTMERLVAAQKKRGNARTALRSNTVELNPSA
jgi:DSF synthase